MKGMNIFCASQASTSICQSHHSSMELQGPHPSSSEPPHLGGRTIDRHNPIIRDSRRLSFRATITPTLSAPCSSSQLSPINPTPYHQLQKHKGTSDEPSPKLAPASDAATKNLSSSKSSKKSNKKKTTSSTAVSVEGKQDDDLSNRTAATLKKSSATLDDFIIPPESSRYLLGEPRSFSSLRGYSDRILELAPVPASQLVVHHRQKEMIDDNSSAPAAVPKLSSSPRLNTPSSDQVVVLRVSLHCRGCEGKLRKHLSRMEGVTSFNIDFAAKKVTVVGDVTPLSVLASVSKVKNAQFWTATSSSATKK
ncbi:hypothetical protein SAY86_015313 [Trapa natans]|uniref:HMA domain-containing protein n=1 Tax=Trapa natans TaxID=22666 RepID=A0AAN7KEI7_TRANT|nr:hypothetical protein SAY86_015313 [Trapa natans]